MGQSSSKMGERASGAQLWEPEHEVCSVGGPSFDGDAQASTRWNGIDRRLGGREVWRDVVNESPARGWLRARARPVRCLGTACSMNCRPMPRNRVRFHSQGAACLCDGR